MKHDAASSNPTGFAFGPFRIDASRHQLERGGEPIAITAKAFETLLLLVRNRDRVVEKEELLACVWPDAFVSEDSLTQAISVLRKAMGDDSSQPVYIATVPRRGYRFVAPVVVEETVEEEGVATPDASPATPPATPVRAAGRVWTLLPLGLAAAVALFVVARTVTVAPRGTPTGAPIRFTQALPDGTMLGSGGVLSPDGRYLAFVAQETATGRAALWLRAMDAPVPHVIAGTDGAYKPFWSPDSRAIGFFSDGKLKRVGVTGAPPQTLAPVGYRPSGGSWSARGVIIYADRLSQLFAVPESGGTASNVTALDPSLKETGHHGPYFLPDGDHFLFTTSSADPDGSATYAGRLGANERTRLLDGSASNVIYAPQGYLLYVRDNVLMAQRFDPAALRLTGAPAMVPAANAAQEEGEARVGAISASANGLLTFGGDRQDSHLTWFSRDGRQLSVIAAPANLHNPALSPDERSLVADGGGVWLIDLTRGAPTRLAPEGNLPAWTASGTHVAFTSRRLPGMSDIFIRSVEGRTDAETLLVRSNEMKIAGNWSRDGRSFVYTASNPQTRLDLWVLPADGTRTPRPFLQSPSNEMQPQISPDGRWLAYASDESGNWEVYVQSFPVPGRKRTVSVAGGAQPEWRGDGRELYYISPDGTLMAVDVRGDETLDVGRPAALFRVPIVADIISYRNQYVVAANGQRFVVALEGDRDPINVVVNWDALVNP